MSEKCEKYTSMTPPFFEAPVLSLHVHASADRIACVGCWTQACPSVLCMEKHTNTDPSSPWATGVMREEGTYKKSFTVDVATGTIAFTTEADESEEIWQSLRSCDRTASHRSGQCG